MPKTGSRKLSNIEMTVLGMAWLRGPCTIYSIMKELSSSESTYHKSRAGTAYSVSKRLLGFKLLENAPSTQGDEKLVRITESGIEELKKWLAPPVPLPDVAHSADLLRLRFFFLGVTDQQARLAFIDDSLKGLHIFLERCEGLVYANEEIGDYYGALATLSSVLETRARIEWMKIVRKWVESPIPDEQGWAKTILSQGIPTMSFDNFEE